MKRHSRIILIGHEGCLWYLHGPFSDRRPDVSNKVVADLRRARSALLTRVGQQTEVLLYFGKVAEDTVTFQTVSPE